MPLELVITSPTTQLSEAVLAEALGILLAGVPASVRKQQPIWLAPSTAAQLTVETFDPNGAPPNGCWTDLATQLTFLQTTCAQCRSALPIDVNVAVQPLAVKALLIADMESTIIEQEMLDELADYVGRRAEVEAITAGAMRGELDFETALNDRVALLAGLDASVLDTVAAERLTYMPGARTLVATMKANGAYCALVSGGFTHFTAKVAAELGFDEHRANTLEVKDGKLTGRVIPPILGRDAKLAALHEIAGRLNVPFSASVAVGDGSNDLAMLSAAGLGVAFRAKPAVRDAMAAHPSGALITTCDLTGLLYLQGVPAARFADQV